MRHNTIYSGSVFPHTPNPLSQGLTTFGVPLNQNHQGFHTSSPWKLDIYLDYNGF